MTNRKVLHITLRSDVGGGPEHLHQLVSNLPEGIQTTIACPKDEPYYTRYQRVVGPSLIVEIPHRSFSWTSLFRVSATIQKKKLGLIHSHGKGAGLYSRLLALMTNRPCVHTFHGLHVGEYPQGTRGLYYAYEYVAGLATTAAICVSEGERELISQTNILPDHKLHVIDNGVSIPELRTMEPSDKRLQIVAVSRFDYQKNPELLLEIADGLRDRIGSHSFNLMVYGTGERFDAFKDALEQRALSACVTLAGPTSALRDRFREAHVFLSTSRWEGMPLAVLEAMSEGLPVAATDVVGNRDAVSHGKSGLLFSNEDAQSGISALLELRNPAIRRVLGLGGRQIVEERYSVSRMASQTAALYEHILKSD